ncbi:O-antigen ligase [Pullulanibacillus pueri]|uniref:Polysaccharide polymerase n=1 Tax=Pullulanibacillus pueri TaxID=1437324 RepID=A0A8J2ZTN1_9BACL|nr:O-antigen ligase family protein [Pullulanibacillus pueri]MBM7681890.1 O-antigen ligase [Pullulanibacillus pueri]GGH76484.1 polysaccharide polymerase [Pullulanibacillus pueri]
MLVRKVGVDMKQFGSEYGELLIALLLIILGGLTHNALICYGLTIIIAIYSFFRPKKGLMVLAIYVPIRPFLIEIEGTLKAVADGIILFALLRVLYDARHNLSSIFRLKWFEWAFWLYCIIGSLSGLLTGVPLTAVIFESRALLLFFLLFYIIRRLDITQEDIKRLIWIVFWVAILLSLHGWVEKLSIRSWLLPLDWVMRPLSPTNRIRIYGLIDNPNTLALFLVLSYFFSFYLRGFYKGALKVTLHIGSVILLGTMILTFSRGVFIGLVFCSLLYLVLSRHWRHIAQTALYLALGILIVALPIILLSGVLDDTYLGETQHRIMEKYDQEGTTATKRLSGTFGKDNIEQDSRTGRIFYVKKGLEIFRDHPILGTGFDTFGDSATLSYPSPIYTDYGIAKDTHIYSDNQYIQVMAQTGVVGVLIIAVFLLGMLKAIWDRRKTSNLALPLGVFLIGLYVTGCYYNVWENNVVGLFYFPFLAVVLPLKDQADERSHE